MSYPSYDHHRAFADITAERRRQDDRWGPQHHDDGTSSTYAESADHWKDVVNEDADDGTTTWAHILLEEIFEALSETDPAKLRAELVQSAAVIVNWIEDIDSRAKPQYSPRLFCASCGIGDRDHGNYCATCASEVSA